MESLQKYIEDNFKETMSMIIAGVLIAVLVVFKDWLREKITETLLRMRWLKKHPPCPEPSLIESDRQIREVLTELRTLVGSERVHVWQFHNGSVFSSQNPIFRITCSHESCKQGVSHEQQNCQGLLATLMLEMIGPMFGVDTDAEYVSLVDNPQKLPLFWLAVSKMPSSYCRSMLSFQGTRYVCVSPLIYQDQKRSGLMQSKIMGFVSASFNDKADELPLQITEIARCASEISYAVNSIDGYFKHASDDVLRTRSQRLVQPESTE